MWKFLLFLLLPICVYASNLGTAKEPLEINNEQDLVWIRDAINLGKGSFKGVDISNGAPNIFFKLTKNLDLSVTYKNSSDFWTPIGTAEHPFMGNFDGDGKYVANIEIVSENNPYQHLGLFGYVQSPEQTSGKASITKIQNLSVYGTISTNNSQQFVGGIAGYAKNDVNFINCHSNVNLQGITHLGGIVGFAEYSSGGEGFQIKNCTNNGKINASSAGYAGGIISEFNGLSIRVDNCKNTGKIAGDIGGGIIGIAQTTQDSSGIVKASVNTGEVSCSKYAAGIVGMATNILFTDNFNSGLIKAQYLMAANAAGIAASVTSTHLGYTHKNNVNAGEVISKITAGGIFAKVGPFNASTKQSIEQNLNLGSINGMSAGGIVGEINKGDYTISSNMNAGPVKSNTVSSEIIGEINRNASITFEIKQNLNVGFTDSTQVMLSNNQKPTSYAADSASIYSKHAPVNDRQMDPRCATSTIDYCAATTTQFYTTQLTTASLPAALDNDIWEAQEGYYPQIKSLKESPVEEIRAASALAATPVYFATTNSIWNFDAEATVPSTDANESTLTKSSSQGGLINDADKIKIYTTGFDTILISNNFATKKIPVYNNISGSLGSIRNPLTINSANELMDFANAVRDSSEYKGFVLKNGGEGLHFKLTANVDMQPFCENSGCTPIGPFTGSFNGGNHTISNLTIETDNTSGLDAYGLFSNVTSPLAGDTTYFENLVFSNAKVQKNGFSAVGTLIGRIVSGNVVVRNIKVLSSTIEVDGINNSAYVGGILGMSLSSVLMYNNEAYTTIRAKNGKIHAGGIVGLANGNANIFDNTSRGSIQLDSTTGPYIGGIVGQIMQGSLRQNTNYGLIHADSCYGFSYIGGIAGILTGPVSILQNNKNFGNIEITGDQGSIGGIFGQSLGYLTDSLTDQENHGNIKVTEIGTLDKPDQGGVGGIIGYSPFAKIKNLKNTGSITVSKKSVAHIGGVVGYAGANKEITVSSVQNDGDITFTNNITSSQARVGGVIGFAAPSGTMQISDVVNNGNILAHEDNPQNIDLFAAGIIGGLTAKTNLSVTNVVNNGNISAKTSDDTQLGGIIALASMDYSTKPTIQFTNTRNNGDITLDRLENSKSTVMIGGLIANALGVPKISNSENIGNITINDEFYSKNDYYTAAYYVGGIIGDYGSSTASDVALQNIFNSGNINARISDKTEEGYNSGYGVYCSGIIGRISSSQGRAENIANFGGINVQHVGKKYIGGLFGSMNFTTVFEIENALVGGGFNSEVSDTALVGAVAGYAANVKMSSILVTASNGIPDFALDVVGQYSVKNKVPTITVSNIVFDQQMTAQESEDYIDLYATTELTKLGLADELSSESWVKKNNLYPELKIFAESEDELVSEISEIAATPIYLINTDTTEYANQVGFSFDVETKTPGKILWNSNVEGFTVTGSKANFNGIDRDTFAILNASSKNANKPFFLRLVAKNKTELDFTNIAWNYTSPFDYDGEEKTVSITGLPEGVTATYEQNSGTRPGTYEAEVIFNYDESLFTKPAFDTKQTWEIKKKVISLSDVKWDYAGMFDYDSTIKKVSLKNVPEEVYVDYLNNAQLDSGKYVAKAMIHYDEDLYDIEGETYYELTWLISYDTTTTETPETEESSSSGAVSSSSSETTNSSSSNTENIGVRTTPVIAVRLIRNGADSYILNFDRTDASDIQIQVFDMMGHQIPVEINRQGNKAELVGIPKNRTSLVRVHSGSISKTLRIQ